MLRRCSLKRSRRRLPVSQADVHASAPAASDAVHHILRLTGEAILDGM